MESVAGPPASRNGAFRDWAELVPVTLLFAALKWAPLPLARLLIWSVEAIVQQVTRRGRRIAFANLQFALPDTTEAERERILKGVYDNLARNVLMLARLPRLNPRNISDWVSYDGLEHYQEGIDKGRGVLFLTAHLGGWELSSAAHALFGHPMWVMVRTLDNPLLDALVNGRRRLFGNRVIRKQDAAKLTLKALRNNEAVGILADQNTIGADGVFVDFFGRPAAATKSVAQLARQTGAAVVFGFALWQRETGRFVLRFRPVEMVESDDREADLGENTRRCQAAIEGAVREHPEQWLWIHDRWKRGRDIDPGLQVD